MSLTGVVEVVDGAEFVGLTATMLMGIICCELAGAYRIVPPFWVASCRAEYGEGELNELVVRQDDEFDEELERGGDE